jgi:2-amino-4-hydroxy-6-hydroxymethyldihydropteridine diphosphokinase
MNPRGLTGGEPAGGLPAWAVVRPERLAHICRVVAVLEQWADALHLPVTERARWLRAAWLHDALRDAPIEEQARWAGSADGPPGLLHGPAAAARAMTHGERDPGVLDAVRYHSVGYAGWDRVGRALYAADFLEPGRRVPEAEREARARLLERFPAAPAEVLREVAQRRLCWVITADWPIVEETWRFWNTLVQGGGAW